MNKRLRLYNPPKNIPMREYDKTRSDYVHQASQVSGVKGIFTMGSVKAPGLSDLDMIVVVDDSFNPQQSAALSVTNFSDDIFLHGPIVIHESLFDKLPYIIFATNLMLCYGSVSATEFDDLNDEAAHILELVYIIDFTESRLVQSKRVVAAGSIDQRAWMTRLWSLTHSEALCKKQSLALSTSTQEVLDTIRNLRSSWLDQATIDEDAFMYAFAHFFDANLEMFTLALHKLYETSPAPHNLKSLSYGNKRIQFSEDVSGYQSQRHLIKVFSRSIERIHIVANPRYACHMMNYGFMNLPACSEYMVLQQRAKHIKQHQAWLVKNCPDVRSLSGHLGVAQHRGKRSMRLIKALLSYGFDMLQPSQMDEMDELRRHE